MISYRPFWETLAARRMTTYDLIFRQGLSANTIHRIKHNAAITTKTINELCFILQCPVSDIIEYVEESD
ncbi:MAG: helix-turn-helix domain-containing protein [Clostridia bacterium]